MAVDTAQAGRWLGGIDTTAPGVSDDLTALIDVATARVDRYAPDAPQSVRDQAQLRLVASMWHHRGTPDRAPRHAMNLFVSSGARALLSDWRVAGSSIAEVTA